MQTSSNRGSQKNHMQTGITVKRNRMLGYHFILGPEIAEVPPAQLARLRTEKSDSMIKSYLDQLLTRILSKNPDV